MDCDTFFGLNAHMITPCMRYVRTTKSSMGNHDIDPPAIDCGFGDKSYTKCDLCVKRQQPGCTRVWRFF
jgi:hypothetical protein